MNKSIPKFNFVRNFQTRAESAKETPKSDILGVLDSFGIWKPDNKRIKKLNLFIDEFLDLCTQIELIQKQIEIHDETKNIIKKILQKLEEITLDEKDTYKPSEFEQILEDLHTQFKNEERKLKTEEKAVEKKKEAVDAERVALEQEKSGAEDLVRSFSPLYKNHAEFHNKLRYAFLTSAFFLVILTITFIYWSKLLTVIVNILKIEEGQSILEKAAETPPLLFFGLFIWAIQLCIQEYRANTHYYLEYQSKVTTLEMFDNLLAAQKIDKENYLPLFTLVLEKIIDNPSSAYIKNEPPKIMPISINKI